MPTIRPTSSAAEPLPGRTRHAVPRTALALVALGAAALACPPARAAPATRQVGSLTLTACDTAAPWCGRLARPLDPRGAVPGTVSIYFEYYPHRAPGPSAGTLVAAEGGPGFPTTESRDSYLAMYGPLLADRDLVLMDYRGTGRSGALACPKLEAAATLTPEVTGECGRSLGEKAWLYGTGLAADDLAALLAALGTGPVDLYGDSYGTYFAQVFAVRHPGQVRSLVLDGAYALSGPDYAWYPSYAPAMRAKFDLACARSAACRRIPGSSIDHIAPALASLRAHPFAARASDADGRVREFEANATALAVVMFGSSPDDATVRETDAAARAFVAGDRPPLLRLMAESLASVDSRVGSPQAYSAGLEAAVLCGDPPHIYDMTLPPAARAAERDRMIAGRERRAPGTYAPFTLAEYRGMPIDYAYLDECVDWPARPTAPAPPPLLPPGASFPDLPVLVLSGDLDDMTTLADGAAAAAQFPRARRVVIVNGFHVNAEPHSRSACGAQIVRAFIRTLRVADAACAAQVPPVRLVARFARTLAELPPARPLPGNQTAAGGLRAVTAAVETVGDVIARLSANTTGRGVGLRGGSFRVARQADGARLTLTDVRWTEDLAVSGTVDWPGRSGEARAQLQLAGPAGMAGTLAVSWPEGVADARARARGVLGGATVEAEAPAPY
jgi:pimeloyl-ACP methyl ester carboxylesterase